MLQVKDISFGYRDSDQVIKSMSFNVDQGQNVSIIGESGCGKSTLLRLIYGLEDLKEGEILFQDQLVLGPSYHLVPGVPEMKYLSQKFDLMSFISVSENIGKFISNFDLAHKKQRIHELLDMIEMNEFATTQVRFLSGGQQQRVALARVLANEPKLLLLDEPFSQIDGFRKNAFRRNLFSYLKKKNISCVVATHDSIDALSYADKVIVIKDGQLLTEQNPNELYNNPPTRYIASLFGEVNEIPLRLLLPEEKNKGVLIYPHEIKVDQKATFRAIVKKSFFRGSTYLVQAVFEKRLLFLESSDYISERQEIGISIPMDIVYRRMK